MAPAAVCRRICARLLLALLAGVGTAAPARDGEGGGTTPPPAGTLPQGVVLIKGATASASDGATPLPEGGHLETGLYQNDHFRLRLTFPKDWSQPYEGAPPSDSGYYVLAQRQPPDAARAHGTVLVAARDLFFTPLPGSSALEQIRDIQAHLQGLYRVDQPAPERALAGHSFVHLGYSAPTAGLHWSVFAMQIRCHLVQFVITSPDTRFLEAATRTLQGPALPAAADSPTGGAESPVCIADYAGGVNLLSRVDPLLPSTGRNPIPVRIIIDTTGQVRHLHFLSAFPDQAQAITTAVKQWRFKPYQVDGHPVEVETGLLFGRSPPFPHPALSRSP